MSPEAEIVMFTVPYQIKPFTLAPFVLMVTSLLTFFIFLGMIPLLWYMTYAVAKERENNLSRTMLTSGLIPLLHYASWLVHFTILNLISTILFTVGLKVVIFKVDSAFYIFLLTFFAN